MRESVDEDLEYIERRDGETTELIDHGLITNDGLAHLSLGWNGWRIAIPDAFATQLSFGEDFDPGDTGFADTVAEEGRDLAFTQDLISLGSEFGLPEFVVGAMFLVSMIMLLVALTWWLAGDATFALPYIGSIILATTLVGLTSLVLFAVFTFILFGIAMMTVVQKYVAST